jgi:hypothetical protein
MMMMDGSGKKKMDLQTKCRTITYERGTEAKSKASH